MHHLKTTVAVLAALTLVGGAVVNQTISVDAEVEEVFGPRLFTIDESHWGDLDGTILVLMPTALAALVGDDDLVGRQVNLGSLKVAGTAQRGFFVTGVGRRDIRAPESEESRHRAGGR